VRGHILVVEDRPSLRRMLEHALEGEGYRVEAVATGSEAIERLRSDHGGGDGSGEGAGYDLVLTDLKLPGASGLEVLAAARSAHPRLPVVVLTAYGTVATAVEAMKLGAWDFLEKPVEIEDLFRIVAAAVGEAEGEAEDDLCLDVPGGPRIVGRHPRLRSAARLLARVAPRESTVLLTGESGTGKELFARALHALSPRASGPFVAVNCAAIPEALMENELFGHEKGAFTGADRRQPGRFELARGGTLLLDEIGELGTAVQGKVLRVLEERTFERVGSGVALPADVRLVAATNRDLEDMVERRLFRSDLYFRLAVFPIELPPLRQRSSDVPLLVRHLLERLAERHGAPAPRPSEDALELLATQPWPGNVRELANVLERAVILAEGARLTAAELRPLMSAPAGARGGAADGRGAGERERIRRTLIECGGDKKRAAERLGMSYRTLQRKVRELDLEGVPHYRDGR
jgi:DNA-binding NtrC family response regulator